MSCVSCKKGKRACVGPLPCARCRSCGIASEWYSVSLVEPDFDVIFPFSVVAVSKKRGRPLKKTVKKENDDNFPQDIEISASLENHGLFEDAELAVDQADLDLFCWLKPGDDLFADCGLFPPLLDAFGPSIVKQNDLMLSMLLSRDGAPAFISRAREIASAFGIDLNGRVWALVHHCGSESESQENFFGNSKVVSLGGVNQHLLGKSVASLGYVYGESMFQVLRTHEKCQIGTLHTNEIVVTSDDRRFPMRTRYVFYKGALSENLRKK